MKTVFIIAVYLVFTYITIAWVKIKPNPLTWNEEERLISIFLPTLMFVFSYVGIYKWIKDKIGD